MHIYKCIYIFISVISKRSAGLFSFTVRVVCFHVAVCCSILQCVAVCCSVLQCVAVCCSILQCVAVCRDVLQCVAQITAELTVEKWYQKPRI